MEWIILAIALLLMAPAAALPFLMAENESMEREALKRPLPSQRVTPVMPRQPGASNGMERSAA